MRPQLIDVDLDAADADGIAQSQTPSGAGALTLNGALGTTLDVARILLLTTAADETTKTFTFTGTDADGNAISEVVTGVNNTTAVTTKFFKTVTSIVVSAATTGAITIGTRGTTLVAASNTVPLNFYDETAPTVSVDVTGTISFTIQERFDNVLKDGTSTDLWVDVTALASKSADTTSLISKNASAVRVKINSYSSGAELQVRIISSHEC